MLADVYARTGMVDELCSLPQPTDPLKLLLAHAAAPLADPAHPPEADESPGSLFYAAAGHYGKRSTRLGLMSMLSLLPKLRPTASHASTATRLQTQFSALQQADARRGLSHVDTIFAYQYMMRYIKSAHITHRFYEAVGDADACMSYLSQMPLRDAKASDAGEESLLDQRIRMDSRDTQAAAGGRTRQWKPLVRVLVHPVRALNKAARYALALLMR